MIESIWAAAARLFTVGATLGAVASCGAASTAEPVASDSPEGYELVFSDEFGADDLDSAWSTCYWWQVDGGCTIASNDEQEWYRPEGVEVGNGSLRLTASADEQATTDGDSLPFTSGLVTTGHTDANTDEIGFEFTYGYVEARIRLPDGDGTWPAVWLLSADRTSLPEIDLFEWYGSRPAIATSHVHQRIDEERSSERVDAILEPTENGWHTVAALWESDRVVFFLDGVETGRVVDPELIPTTPMYLIVNLALGGPAGDVDDDALPQSLLVDHIRIWQIGDES